MKTKNLNFIQKFLNLFRLMIARLLSLTRSIALTKKR